MSVAGLQGATQTVVVYKAEEHDDTKQMFERYCCWIEVAANIESTLMDEQEPVPWNTIQIDRFTSQAKAEQSSRCI